MLIKSHIVQVNVRSKDTVLSVKKLLCSKKPEVKADYQRWYFSGIAYTLLALLPSCLTLICPDTRAKVVRCLSLIGEKKLCRVTPTDGL